MTQLEVWAEHHGARPWRIEELSCGGKLVFLITNKHRFVVVHHLADGGWELYVAATASNDIQQTLNAVSAALEMP